MMIDWDKRKVLVILTIVRGRVKLALKYLIWLVKVTTNRMTLLVGRKIISSIP
jgi:hypothetical protein